jgi:hypothetical protein
MPETKVQLMKTAINFLKMSFFYLFFLIGIINTTQAQVKTSIKSIIDSKHFVFKVQTIFPTGGPARQTNGEYDLKISGDSLVSYLPYFGRAYSVPLPGEGGGYNFSSSDFQYIFKTRKRGGWEITIKPRDVKDFREFSLILSEKGYGTLRALSNNRQAISYSGYIAAVK